METEQIEVQDHVSPGRIARRFGTDQDTASRITGFIVDKSRLSFRKEYWDFLLEEGVWEDCTPSGS